VKTADGSRYPAGHVVLASGCWSGQARWLPEGARPPVRPVKGQILRLRGPADEPLCERIVRTPSIYVVSRGAGRAVLGATVEERGFDTTVTAGGVHELLREAHRVLPGIGELELVEATAGLRPGTPDSAPLIGPGAIDGLILATGHYRNGILLAPPTADAVAAILAGEQPAVSVAGFGPHRFDRAHAPSSSAAHLSGTGKEPHAEHAGVPPPPGRPRTKPARVPNPLSPNNRSHP
jgi:glycine oxidase